MNDTLLSHVSRVARYSERLCFPHILGSTQVSPCVGDDKVTERPYLLPAAAQTPPLVLTSPPPVAFVGAVPSTPMARGRFGVRDG